MELQSIKNRFGVIGNDPQLNYALSVADQVANTDLSVLIFGESGVGKEVFSQIIHSLSSRKHNPFIAVNCGAIPEGTIDSELFGHEKGSFTSAGDQRKGYFETVNGGTIFLDEIAEMPVGTQARLLRVLETGEYIRVGSSKVMKTNVRVVAATNKDLLALTQTGAFREDLYYRLNTVPIRVPALRERREDINLLFRKFVGDFAEKYRTTPVQLDHGAQELLKSYGWPGNVRELKNIAEQVSVLAKDKTVTADQLTAYLPNEKNITRLPAVAHQHALPAANHEQDAYRESSTTEREILYKLFFDLKRDMNDLKKMMFDMARHQDFPLSRHDAEALQNTFEAPANTSSFNTPAITNYPGSGAERAGANPSLVIHQPGEPLTGHEEVEESLSLADREREFIIKSLKKHRGKRKDAAHELGISERTLYRKIKEYDIEE